MTEAEWLASDDPEPMLRLTTVGVQTRKQRLFCVACCRRVLPWVPAECAKLQSNPVRFIQAVDSIELLVDGHNVVDDGDLLTSGPGSNFACGAIQIAKRSEVCDWDDPVVAVAALASAAVVAPEDSIFLPWGEPGEYEPAGVSQLAELAAQSTLIRDIFGNPFRPVALAPAWRTDTAVTLARQMYDARDFSAMPILADALQDAGCDSADVLDHCRGPGPHVRGCWVCDLVLGKE